MDWVQINYTWQEGNRSTDWLVKALTLNYFDLHIFEGKF
jgi:hypothetical protein